MSRSLLLYCDDILDAIETIREYVREIDFEEFARDPMRADAVLYPAGDHRGGRQADS